MSDLHDPLWAPKPTAASAGSQLLDELDPRRQHHRYTAKGEVTLSWEAHSATGTVADVSTKGMALLVRQPVEVGLIVDVKMDSASYRGSVRYCRAQGARFLVGVEIPIFNG